MISPTIKLKHYFNDGGLWTYRIRIYYVGGMDEIINTVNGEEVHHYPAAFSPLTVVLKTYSFVAVSAS